MPDRIDRLACAAEGRASAEAFAHYVAQTGNAFVFSTTVADMIDGGRASFDLSTRAFVEHLAELAAECIRWRCAESARQEVRERLTLPGA